jgi:hypothetical protein
VPVLEKRRVRPPRKKLIVKIGDKFSAAGPAHLLMFINDTQDPWVIQANGSPVRLGATNVVASDPLVCPPGEGIVRLKVKTSRDLPLWMVVSIDEAFQWAWRKRLRVYGWLPAGDPLPRNFRRQVTDRIPSALLQKYMATGDPGQNALGGISGGYIMFAPHYLKQFRYPDVPMNEPPERERILKLLLAVDPPDDRPEWKGYFSINNPWMKKRRTLFFWQELEEAINWGVAAGIIEPINRQGVYRIVKRPG